jgi:hypothetical protein
VATQRHEYITQPHTRTATAEKAGFRIEMFGVIVPIYVQNTLHVVLYMIHCVL